MCSFLTLLCIVKYFETFVLRSNDLDYHNIIIVNVVVAEGRRDWGSQLTIRQALNNVRSLFSIFLPKKVSQVKLDQSRVSFGPVPLQSKYRNARTHAHTHSKGWEWSDNSSHAQHMARKLCETMNHSLQCICIRMPQSRRRLSFTVSAHPQHSGSVWKVTVWPASNTPAAWNVLCDKSLGSERASKPGPLGLGPW